MRHRISRRPASRVQCNAASPRPLVCERSATFRRGNLFYRESSRLIRDLGVLTLAVLASESEPMEPLRVLDAMSGTGVRALRYSHEVNRTMHVHANELMQGDHQPSSLRMCPTCSEQARVELTVKWHLN